MDDFRLKVFVAAASTLSFTKCAKQMCISQPAVSKHIGELEAQYKTRLFIRNGSRLALTAAGEVMLQSAERILQEYRKMQYDVSLCGESVQGVLRLGASTTIAQYLLSAVLAKFTQRFPDVEVSLISGNSDQIEAALIAKTIDLGMVESVSRHKGLHYDRFMADELVAVVATGGRWSACDELSLDELCRTPIVVRENGSGTLDVVAQTLDSHGIKLSDLNIVMHLGSTESIKQFVENSDALAIVSILSVTRELTDGVLRVVDIEGCDFCRDFAFVTPEGGRDALSDRFADFMLHNIQ